MRKILGPRALQALVLLTISNSKAKKLHCARIVDIVKDFIHDYSKLSDQD